MRYGRLIAALLGAGAALLLWPGLALAHATLVHANPPDLCPGREQAVLLDPDPRCVSGQTLTQPPPRVRLLFSEAIQPAGSGISVVGPAGQAVTQGAATVAGNMLSVAIDAGEPGTYLVTWRVVSADTHPAWGRFAFSVGHPSPLPGVDARNAAVVAQVGIVLQTLGHWLHAAGYALAFGPLVFMLFVLGGILDAAAATSLWRLVNAGIGTLLAAEVPALIGQMAGLGTGQFFDGDLFAALLASSYGLVLAQRLGTALVLWVLLGVVGPGGRAASDRIRLGLALLPGLVLAFIDGEASHAIDVQPAWLGLVSNAVHLAAMGAWVGGLAALLVVQHDLQRARPYSELMGRFGRLAAVALLLLTLSGVLMAGVHLGGLADLLNGSYGQALLVKLGLLGFALGLAAASLYAHPHRRRRLHELELGVLAAVVLLGALLVTLPPPL